MRKYIIWDNDKISWKHTNPPSQNLGSWYPSPPILTPMSTTFFLKTCIAPLLETTRRGRRSQPVMAEVEASERCKIWKSIPSGREYSSKGRSFHADVSQPKRLFAALQLNWPKGSKARPIAAAAERNWRAAKTSAAPLNGAAEVTKLRWGTAKNNTEEHASQFLR